MAAPPPDPVPGRPLPRRAVLLGGAGAAMAACGTGTPTHAPAPPPTTASTAATFTAPTSSALDDLARRLHGTLLRHGQFDPGRLRYNPKFAPSAGPVAVARVASAADVATCLDWCHTTGTPLHVRSGGHSYGGWSSGQGLVIDLSSLSSVRVRGDVAHVGAGALLAHVYSGVAAQGRALGGGSCPSVGVSGLTTGGGQGILTRSYGLTCDQVESATMVTADGHVRTVGAGDDLFWALRGGGPGFGVVTSWTFRTQAAPTITRFYRSWPWAAAHDVVPAWQAWVAHAPDELWSTLKLLHTSAGPRIFAAGTWTGPGSPAFAGLTAGSTTLHTASFADTVLLYAGCTSFDTCVAQAYAPASRLPFTATSSVLAHPLPPAGIDALVSAVAGAHPAGAVEWGTSLDALGGAAATGDSAFPWRSALAIAQHTCTWQGSTRAAYDATVRGLRAAITPWAGTGAYYNYADPGLSGFAAAYWGPHLSRLRSIRRRVDPGNLLGTPQSVPL